MTAFEHYFKSLKKILGEDIYDIWPDFEPEYGEREFTWTTLKGLGEVLILNCGKCEGPSDLRHEKCKGCVETRCKVASEIYEKIKGEVKSSWPTILLCRIYMT